MQSEGLAKKSLSSLLASILPNILGLIAVPILMSNIGVSKFGIFTLSLGIIGYASILDLGMSRLLSKSAAELRGESNLNENLAQVFSFSYTLVMLMSILISVFSAIWFLFYGFKYLTIQAEMTLEVKYSLLWVILSAPLMALTGTLRGGIEGLDYFREANLIQVIGSAGNLVIPALLSFFVTKMSIVFFVLLIFRIILFIYCRYVIHKKISFTLSLKFNRKLFKESVWITLTSFLSPLLIYTDRLTMGGTYSLKEISYYGTPMDFVLRVLILPQALSRVMLPSLAGSKEDHTTVSFLKWSFKVTGIICFPIYWILSGMSYIILKLWVGEELAMNSSLFMTIFSFGLFWNSFTWVTFNFVQAKGLFKEAFFLQIATTIIYIACLPFVVVKGLNSVAWLWTLRLILDTIFISILCYKKFEQLKSIFKIKLIFLIMMSVIWLPLLLMSSQNWLRLLYVVGILLLGSLLVWFKFLTLGERSKILSMIFRRN